mgnify:CR=1 FL=1
MENIKTNTIITLIVLLIFAVSDDIWLRFKAEPKPKETSIIKELEECRKAGGEFWIYQQWGHEKFPAYNMQCEKTDKTTLFEYKD